MPDETRITITVRPETVRLINEMGEILQVKKRTSKRASDAELIHKAVRHAVLRLRKPPSPGAP